MAGIRGEIQQTKAFRTPAQEARVALLRTADVVRSRLEEVLKPYGLTPEQYNILRILRGAPDLQLPTLEVRARMISRAPNITRLIDKMVEKGLVTRCLSEDDRRVVPLRLSARGHLLATQAAPAVDRADAKALGPLGPKRLRALTGLLGDVRGACAKT